VVAAAFEARSDCLNGRAKTPAFVARNLFRLFY
jgi:hypothetical protein